MFSDYSLMPGMRLSDASTIVSRQYLMDLMRIRLGESQRAGSKLSIVVIDLDRRENMSDVHLLKSTLGVITSCTRSSDIICRISENTFVLLLPGFVMDKAFFRIGEAREQLLKSSSNEGWGGILSFSFGLAENTELPYQDDEGYIIKLLDLAYARMEEFKQKTMPQEE